MRSATKQNPLKSRFCPVTTSADGQIFNQTLIALSLTLSLRSSMQRLLVKTREIPHFPSPRCVTLSSDTHNVGQWGSLFKGRDTIQFRSADTPPSLSGSVDARVCTCTINACSRVSNNKCCWQRINGNAYRSRHI